MLQVYWKNYKHPRFAIMSLRLQMPGDNTVYPVIATNNDGLMAIAFPVVRYLMEEWRHRYPMEPVETYLRGAWKRVLERLGLRLKSEEWTELTPKKLVASGILKEMRSTWASKAAKTIVGGA